MGSSCFDTGKQARVESKLWTISSSILCLSMIPAWTSLVFERQDPFLFSALSNLSFVAAGLVIPLLAKRATIGHHPSVTSSSLVIGFAGAASFAHHFEASGGRPLGTPAHVLDVTFGWVVVLELLAVSLAAAIGTLFAFPTTHVVVGTYVVQLGLASTVFANYARIYAHQMQFYAISGVAVALCYGLLHVVRTIARKCSWRTVASFALHAVSLMTILGSSAVLQGEVLRDVVGEQHNYNVNHGLWHLGISVVFLVVQTQVVRMQHAWPGQQDGRDIVVQLCMTLAFFASALGSLYTNAAHVQCIAFGIVLIVSVYELWRL